MSTVKIVLRKEKQKKDGTYPLAIRIIKDRKPRYIHTGYSIFEREWNADEHRVRKSHPNSARLNHTLLVKLAEANEVAIELETNNRNASSKVIRKKIKGEKSGLSFFQFGAERVKRKHLEEVYSVARAERSILCNIEEFLNLNSKEALEKAKEAIANRRRDRISVGRKKGYNFLGHLKPFTSNKSLYFEDINEPLLTQFKVFCHAYLEMKPRTVINQLIFIRTLFNEAIKEGVVDIKHYPFAGEKEKIRIAGGHKIGLSKEEVAKIEELELEEDSSLWHSCNVWLIAYYFAGIRITDALNLQWSDFKDNRLYYTMDKNQKPVSLKIPAKALAIIDKYRKNKLQNAGFLFPFMSSANTQDSHDMFVKARNGARLINDKLKVIAERCGIEKNLSNHIARHTFGNIAGDSIHPLMLQKLYRHADLKTTINYQANFIHKEADEALDSVIG